MEKLERFFEWVASAKVQRALSLFFVLLGVFFFYLAFHTWEMQQEFIESEKLKTDAVVKVKDDVKTLNFPENPYGVVTYDPTLHDGEIVSIYYQKDKPHRVSTSPTQYGEGIKEVVEAILCGCLFLFFVVLTRRLLPRMIKRSAELAGLVEK